MYYPNYIGKDWIDPISGQPVNPMASEHQTPAPTAPAPKEPTIMELLEQNWQKQQEKERPQSMLPDNFGSSYFGQGMSRTAMPANYNQPAQVATEQPDKWLISYLPQGKSTPVPQNLNITTVNTPANTSPIPPFMQKYPKQENAANIKLTQQTNNGNLQNIISATDVAGKILSSLPEYKTLEAAKKEMEMVNQPGYDNYAHRLGMCRIGQMTSWDWPYAPSLGMGLGILKEIKDLYDKSIKGNMSWKESLKDSAKDMHNNFEGLNYGINNPDQDCRKWLKNLNYRSNQWIK